MKEATAAAAAQQVTNTRRTFLARAAILRAATAAMASKRVDSDSVAVISPTPGALIDLVLNDELVKSRPIYSLIDMGCGDGRWLTHFASTFSYCNCVGIDLDAERIQVASTSVRRAGLEGRIDLIQGDFFGLSCSSVDIVIVYLSRLGNEMLRRKFERECADGTIIVAVGFQMKGWRCQKVIECSKPKSFVEECSKPKSSVEEHEKPKSSVEEHHEKPKSSVEECGMPKSSVEEVREEEKGLRRTNRSMVSSSNSSNSSNVAPRPKGETTTAKLRAYIYIIHQPIIATTHHDDDSSL